MKYLSAVAFAGLAIAAPLVDTSGKKHAGNMLNMNRRQDLSSLLTSSSINGMASGPSSDASGLGLLLTGDASGQNGGSSLDIPGGGQPSSSVSSGSSTQGGGLTGSAQKGQGQGQGQQGQGAQGAQGQGQQTGGGLQGNLAQLVGATSLGGPNGQIQQSGGIGGLLAGVPNLADLPNTNTLGQGQGTSTNGVSGGQNGIGSTLGGQQSQGSNEQGQTQQQGEQQTPASGPRDAPPESQEQ